ncbi:putative membrane protein [Escherichia coli MP021017.5]|nr:putative membrane protein [Escherichia coli MP021017.9]EMU75687.1 putative membrane protein [Escherichia coli MP021017.6]EMU78303.1 putative membrane protein [Escherichia coli MP021017.5]EMU90163.1 putative membrane protein [Escherichia coli MP021017.3]EMU92802.1 putative membrane protein [Escherichia coli MP021017.2]EMV04094.1 putative membrane protein [Escherichia coli MP021017.10]
MLSYLQLIALYIVIASNVNFIIELKNKKNKHDLNRRL